MSGYFERRNKVAADKLSAHATDESMKPVFQFLLGFDPEKGIPLGELVKTYGIIGIGILGTVYVIQHQAEIISFVHSLGLFK